MRIHPEPLPVPSSLPEGAVPALPDQPETEDVLQLLVRLIFVPPTGSAYPGSVDWGQPDVKHSLSIKQKAERPRRLLRYRLRQLGCL